MCSHTSIIIIGVIYLQIYQCRKLLFELESVSFDEDTPTKKPLNWKKACGSILIQSVS